MDVPSVKLFSNFYAVVLDHIHGGPLRWSAHHQSWLRRSLGWQSAKWAEQPVADDQVDETQLEQALQIAAEFLGASSCARCWYPALADTHFITTDVLGAPTIYCVQSPNYDVVNSRGGGGTKKHWGSPHGCTAVDDLIVTSRAPAASRSRIVAAYAYGEPLPADLVLLRDWCLVCSGTADNLSKSTTFVDREDDLTARLLARKMLDRSEFIP